MALFQIEPVAINQEPTLEYLQYFTVLNFRKLENGSRLFSGNTISTFRNN